MTPITINENGLTAKTYRFSRRAWGDFGFDGYYGERRSDLCAVVRSICVLMPIVYAVNAAALGFAGWALWTFVLLLWLNLSTTMLIVFIGCAAAGCLALIFSAARFGEKAATAIKRSETARVATAFYKAKKAKICPMVEMAP